MNIQQVIVLVFCVGAAILSVKGDVDQDMKEILNNTNGVLILYDENLDKTVPFKELKASLKVLDSMAKIYTGPSKDILYDASKLGYQAADSYFRATDTIFSWCVKADIVVNYIIKHETEKKTYQLLLQILRKGIQAIEQSIDKLSNVSKQLRNMADTLRPVPKSLESELKQLEQEHKKRVDSLSTKRTGTFTSASFFGAFGSIILGALTGPVGLGIGLAATLPAAGISTKVIHGDETLSENEAWKVTNVYLTSLIKAVEYAGNNVTAVRNALNKKITVLEHLEGDVEASVDLLEVLEVYIINDQLADFSKTLKKFIERHGENSESHRSRREAITYDGLDVDRISYLVDTYMNANVMEREAEFWKTPDLPVNPGVISTM